MISTPIFLDRENKQPVGIIQTEKKIAGSRVNDFKVARMMFENADYADLEKAIDWLMSSQFHIPGAVRPQMLWEVKAAMTLTKGTLVVEAPILRPVGMCVACSGTGKYRASTHRSNAKCPGCRGTGETGVWKDDDKEVNGEQKVVGASEIAEASLGDEAEASQQADGRRPEEDGRP